MSSAVRQLDTASTESPLRRDCAKTMKAFPTISRSCRTNSSDSRSIAPGRLPLEDAKDCHQPSIIPSP